MDPSHLIETFLLSFSHLHLHKLSAEQVVRIIPNRLACVSFSVLSAGQGIRKSDEGDPLLLERDAQHQREQDLQVHHGEALQPAVDGGAQPHHRRAHHRLLTRPPPPPPPNR